MAWPGAGNLSPPGPDPQTIQPIISRYTEAIPARILVLV